ncbi:flagellar basal body-associated FliL family protein [Actinosynnema sp.]|uniref:flagellar basal body-associated FliL family protein n=1 Tax=Actinosynnema sp. TaxID=1872144 RepID=UPI003F861967
MAKDDKKAEKDKPEEGEGKGGGKTKLLIIVAVAVLALGGAGSWFFLFRDSTPAPPEPGTVVALDSITMNLADGHYLKLKLSLQQTKDAAEDVDGSKALDLVVSEFSNRSIAELSSNEARESLKAALQEKVVSAYEDLVMGIYFTEFVTQ